MLSILDTCGSIFVTGRIDIACIVCPGLIGSSYIIIIVPVLLAIVVRIVVEIITVRVINGGIVPRIVIISVIVAS